MEKQRDTSIDFVKIIATLFIIFHHYYQVTGSNFGRIKFYGGKFYFGLMVELFFLISGYLMYVYIDKIWDGLTFRAFFLRRYLRLMPVMAIAAVVYEVLIVCYKQLTGNLWYGNEFTILGTLTAALGIQEGWGIKNYGVNYPTWYISVLLLCYLLFYILVRLAKRLHIPVMGTFLFMIVLGVFITEYSLNIPFMNPQTARGYYAFFAGLILRHITKDREVTTSMFVIFAGVFVSVPLLIHYKYNWMSHGVNYTMTFLYYPSVILMLRYRLCGMVCNRKCIGNIGKILLNVYLWHNPMFILMFILREKFDVGINLNSFGAMVCYAFVCFAIGGVSYFFLEQPIARKMKTTLAKYC